MCPFHDDSSNVFRIYQNKEVAKCYHGYCSYAPLSDIVKHQNQCTIPSSSRICIQISFTYPALDENRLSGRLFIVGPNQRTVGYISYIQDRTPNVLINSDLVVRVY